MDTVLIHKPDYSTVGDHNQQIGGFVLGALALKQSIFVTKTEWPLASLKEERSKYGVDQ